MTFITDHPFRPGKNTSCSPHADKSCDHRGCGRIEEFHKKPEELPQILPAWMEADDWMTKAGYKGSNFFELGRNLLAAYIEWRRGYGTNP